MCHKNVWGNGYPGRERGKRRGPGWERSLGLLSGREASETGSMHTHREALVIVQARVGGGFGRWEQRSSKRWSDPGRTWQVGSATFASALDKLKALYLVRYPYLSVGYP